MKEFKSIAGVPIIACSEPDSPSPVTHKRGARTRRAAPELIERLDSAFSELWFYAGRPQWIVHAGFYAWRDDSSDLHQQGKAMDLVGLEWKDDRPLYCINTPTDNRALGVTAILRRWVPQVLCYHYNKAHRNHWHLDLRAEAMGLQKRSRSDTVFAQAALNELFGEDLVIDGLWGPKTDLAYEAAVAADKWLLRPTWNWFLLRVARRALLGSREG